jgi:hypothetical protein
MLGIDVEWLFAARCASAMSGTVSPGAWRDQERASAKRNSAKRRTALNGRDRFTTMSRSLVTSSSSVLRLTDSALQTAIWPPILAPSSFEHGPFARDSLSGNRSYVEQHQLAAITRTAAARWRGPARSILVIFVPPSTDGIYPFCALRSPPKRTHSPIAMVSYLSKGRSQSYQRGTRWIGAKGHRVRKKGYGLSNPVIGLHTTDHNV